MTQTIVKLEIANYKKIKAVRIRPEDGKPVVIGGKNAQGKSTVLDAIAAAIGGGRKSGEEPIRNGASKAEIEVTTSAGLVVRRRITDSGTTLTVRDADGKEIKSPQQVLDSLVGSGIALDPLAFMRLNDADMMRVVTDSCGLTDTLAELDEKHRQAYEARTAANRHLKSVEARAAACPAVPNAPVAVVSSQQIIDQLSQIESQNARNGRARDWLQTAIQEASIMLDHYRAKQEEADRLKAAHDKLMADIEAKKPKIDALVDEDPEAVRKRLKTLEQENEVARRNMEAARIAGELDAAKDAARDADRRVEDTVSERNKAVASAKLPVEGLSVGDGKVLYKGVPVRQASTAEQIRLGVHVALSANPNLAVLLVREGSMLDADSRAVLEQAAAEHGAQLWIEVVSSSEREGGIIIEDGEIRVTKHEETKELFA